MYDLSLRVSPFGRAIIRYKHIPRPVHREPWADFLRGIAAFCVVLCHVTETVYVFNPSFFAEQSFASQFFAFTSFTIGRMGVPVFFFLSGYLLLTRNYNDRSCFAFWRKNLLPLILTSEIWNVFYNVFLSFYMNTPLDWKMLLRTALFLHQTALGHMWYIPVILGMYLFLPFAARALQSFQPKTFLIPGVVAFICLYLMPVVGILEAPKDRPYYYFLFDLAWSGNGYGVLIAFGYFVKKGCFKKIKTWILAILAALSFTATIAVLFSAYRHGNGDNLWYNWGTLILCTSCLCEICSRRKNLGNGCFFNAAAKYSFGIFLVHFPIKMILERHVLYFRSLPANVLILFSLTLFFSWAFVYFVNKIPRAGKIFFLIKS